MTSSVTTNVPAAEDSPKAASRPNLTICIVDDEETIRLSLSRLFSRRGHDVICAANGAQAIDLVEDHSPDVVLLDLFLPDIGGIEVLRKIKRSTPETAVVMISAHGTVERAVEAIKEGADNFVTKPINVHKLEALLETVGKYAQARRELEYYRRLRGGSAPFVGVSGHAQKVLQLINLMAENPDTTVLLTGESGTGKGVVARLIHEHSQRGSRPFVEVSCVELTPSLLESELFGHERGAFTDAKQTKQGLIEIAHGGTLFLDEIGELDATLQPKLLKILESRTFRRVGGTRDIKVDVRIIAATNVDLESHVERKLFRKDLYYRLKVMPVALAPLREHPEDVQALAEHFVRETTRDKRRTPVAIGDEAMSLMRAYPWPGNTREMRNVIERAMILARGKDLTAADLPAEVLQNYPPQRTTGMQTIEQMEAELIGRTLTTLGGNRTKSALSLGISRSTLQEKLKRYGLS